MTAPIDHRSRTTGPGPRRFRRVLLLLLLIVGLGVLASGALVVGLLGDFDEPPRTKSIAPADVASDFARMLMRWEAFGPLPPDGPHDLDRSKSIERRMRGLNGFTESGGWHGDGTDWYEVELSPDLMAELRAGLSRSSLVKPDAILPQPGQLTPPWWPKEWPAGTVWYRKDRDLSYLVLPPSGTRAWFLSNRW